MPTATSRYFTVKTAARILRCNEQTLYRNIQDVPHIRQGGFLLIPVEWLGYEPPPVPTLHGPKEPAPWFEQPTLPFEVRPQKRWRNNGHLVRTDHFGDALANMW